MNQLSLTHGLHRFVVTYEVGEESHVLDAIVAMVHNPATPLDWFDAAILSHQLGKHLAKELKAKVPPKSGH